MGYLIKCIKTSIGVFLVLWCILFFILGFIFKSVVDILTWFEIRTGRLMKKCMGDEL
jgi:hypothetical protein